MSTKRLGILTEAIGHSISNIESFIEISGVTFDSRKVSPGFIFVALKGLSVDGHRFIPQAIRNGASAIVGSERLNITQVPYMQVSDTRDALAKISSAFYGNPARRLTVIGVTGTDGKTTTSNMIYRIIKAAGIDVGMISTVNAMIGDRVLDTGFHVTTPEAPDVQHYLSEMLNAGLTHAVLEVTSHGLEQKRVGECQFDIGVITNIQHEHLDYHKTYRNYQQAKGLLFQSLAQTQEKTQGNYRLAVLNKDDQSYSFLSALLKEDEERGRVRIFTYGLNPSADVQAKQIIFSKTGTDFLLEINQNEMKVHLNLLGSYNVSNALAAITVTVLGLGIESEIAIDAIARLKSIPGRMEQINLGQPFNVIVDFAHTPNALKQALISVRQMTRGRVIAVFGSAGLRDREKRGMMAEVSSQYADVSIFTAEDPRTESLDDILAEMADAARSRGGKESKTYYRIPDRGNAIRYALNLARPHDLVIVLGKGHEQSMCFGEREYPWDDRTAVRAALAEFMNVPGPEMPYLPTAD
ncbi:MAG: UDP-N-acetylmuramoyl-L-alanyl-D-glutamate--2,6-diaminopimelate ligase [Anaerolineales bacterium]|nr:UDP-N-acetylmuramoyl-L-alanyl-D-glutamate--2,6-diaminopimelate ligase [Anaerolineales bacterium]